MFSISIYRNNFFESFSLNFSQLNLSRKPLTRRKITKSLEHLIKKLVWKVCLRVSFTSTYFQSFWFFRHNIISPFCLNYLICQHVDKFTYKQDNTRTYKKLHTVCSGLGLHNYIEVKTTDIPSFHIPCCFRSLTKPNITGTLYYSIRQCRLYFKPKRSLYMF